ncbi:MAG: PAS domain-containing protein [Egibacteraceae bacterium]
MRTGRSGDLQERATPRRRLAWGLALTVVALVAAGGLSWSLFDALERETRLRHGEDLAQLARLSRIADAYTLSVRAAVTDVERGSLSPAAAAEGIAAAQADAAVQWRGYRRTLPPLEQARLVAEIDERLGQADARLDELRSLAAGGGRAAFVDGAADLGAQLTPLGVALAELRNAHRAEAGAQAQQASAAFDRLRTAALALVAALGAAVLVLIVRLEQGRRVSERRAQRLTTLLDDSPDLVASFDTGLRHRYVNEAVLATTGQARGDFLGRTIAEVSLPPALAARWEEALAAVLDSGQPRTVEAELATVDRPRAMQSRVIAERDRQGAITGCSR